MIIPNEDYVSVNIIGLPRTGKTTLAKRIVEKELKGFKVAYINENYLENLETLKNFEYDKLCIILDDFSYHEESRSKKLAHFLCRIFHEIKANRIVVFTIFHYIHSVMPIVRLSHVRILTSITCQYEMEILKKYFDLDYLWAFYDLYVQGLRHIALVNREGVHFFIRFKKTKLWEYEPIIEGTVKIPIKDVDVDVARELLFKEKADIEGEYLIIKDPKIALLHQLRNIKRE